MKIANRRISVLLGALGVASVVALTAVPVAQAQEKMTAQSLIDRQMILDQITRYYYNFGRATKAEEASFYAEDGVLILGNAAPRKGREAIAGAYGGGARPAAPAAGAAPAAAALRRGQLLPLAAASGGGRCGLHTCCTCLHPGRRARELLQRDGRQSTDHRARRYGNLGSCLHRVPDAAGGLQGEAGVHDAGQGIRHLGQGEGPVAVQVAPDHRRQQSSGRLEGIKSRLQDDSHAGCCFIPAARL